MASYSPLWVTVSILIAILASYAALRASARIAHVQDTFLRITWISISSFVFGLGTWAMHFIGMLALSLPCGIHYDPVITLVSMIPGILAAGIAFGVVWHHGKKHLPPFMAGILFGAGIGTMHYTGMAALHLDGFIRYNPSLFALSILVAIVLSYMALHVKNKAEEARQGIVPVAVILGGAVSAMHYTAMAATYFMRGEIDTEIIYFTPNTLAFLVAITTVILALAALALAAFSRNREITELLRESEERLNFALESAEDGVWDWNPQTDEAMFSKRWKEMIGYAEQEFPNAGSAWFEHLHPEDRERILAAVQDYFSGKIPLYVVEFRMRCKDGSWKWILARGKTISRDANGTPLRMIGTQTDISERKNAELALHESNQKLDSLLNSMAEGAYGVDLDGNCTFVNRSFLALLGFEHPDEIIGKHLHEIIHHSHTDGSPYPAMECRMYKAYRQNQEVHVDDEVFWKKDGTPIAVEYWSQPIIVGGVVQGAIATFVDITERKLAEAQIHNLAFYDALTQLPNRRLLYDRLDHAIAASKRSSCYGALMFMDLDNFKLLNDTHGHKMGDLLLIEVARRIESCIRETDTVARFGGDEFVVLLGDLDEDATESERQALAIAERIRAGLSEPYYLAISQEADSLLEHRCSSSIGVVMFHHSVNREALLKSTDEAMYKAKEMGRNCVVVEQYAGPVGAEQKATILRLEWHDSYGCGEPTIDEEHRKLFDLANALIRSAFTRDEEPKRFDEDLERLLTHIVQHFSDEEAILESHHYPDLAAHRHAHQILVRKAKQLMKTAESGGISIGKLVNFLANEVIAQHMLKMDCKFYSLFEKNFISQAD